MRYPVEAARTAGLRAAAGLVKRAVTERSRPHTQYFTRESLLAHLAARFEVAVQRETAQRESTILYAVARRKTGRRLPLAE